MVVSSSNAYHTADGLERAVLDLVRVGARGHAPGVRQLAARLLRALPLGVTDQEAFRNALHEAITASPSQAQLRFGAGTVPTEQDTTHPLADVDVLPDGDGLVLGELEWELLREVVAERERADELRRLGVPLTRTLLLSGPPGVGKTMAARWLASALSLPLVTLDLSAVVSSYLGSSGRNIRSVLDYGKSAPCVLLLDEFDALAKRRDDDGDVGELKRIVNVVLVELDRWPDGSLLVAATNHAQLLDPAVERRFDRSLEMRLPGREQRLAILTGAAWQSNIPEGVLEVGAEVTEGMNGSALVRLWDQCRRRSLLQERPITEVFLQAIARQLGADSHVRDRIITQLHDRLRMSNRQVAEIVGVSHPTVAAALKREGVKR